MTTKVERITDIIKPNIIGAPFIINGLGERNKLGSYIKIVAINEKDDFRIELSVSKGQAENLSAELAALAGKMKTKSEISEDQK